MKKTKKILSVMLMVSMLVSAFRVGYAEPEYRADQIVSNGAVLTTEDGRVQHSKIITQTGVNEFRIDLTVRTKEDILTQSASRDAAVVLVLDVSNSMDADDIAAARDAADNFVSKLLENAGDGKRRVALVEFGSNAQTVLGWTDPKGSGQETVNAAVGEVNNRFSYNLMCSEAGEHTHQEQAQRTAASVEYRDKKAGKSAGWYCTVCETRVSRNAKNNMPDLKDTVHSCFEDVSYTGTHVLSSAKDSGGTNIEGALRLANNLLAADDVSDIRNKYVVLMTDGVPTFHVTDGNESGSTTFMQGTAGGSNYAAHDDYHDIFCTASWQGSSHINSGDNIPQQIKDKGAEIYTVTYKSGSVSGTVNGSSIDAWLASFATGNITANENIFAGLGSVAEIIVNQARAWILTDPMGQFIDFSSDDIAVVTDENADAQSAVVKYNRDRRILTWDLKSDTSRKGPENGWYTYTKSYCIKLNTAAEGFAEGQGYAANGTTVLSYMLSEDGQLQQELLNTELAVPVVKGCIPEYAFSVKYYKQGDAEKGDYESYTEVTGDALEGYPADLHTTVALADLDPAFRTRYDGENYHFVKAEPASVKITSDPGRNVMKVYYDRDTTSATVNHFYKLATVQKDGTETVRDWPDAPDNTVTVRDLYVNDPFIAEEITGFGSETYELNIALSDSMSIAHLNADAGENVIDLYYELTQDLRDPADVAVDHVYRLHTWVLNGGRYELADAEPVIERNVEVSSGMKAHDRYTAENRPIEGYEAYIADAGNQPEIHDLKPGENRIVLYFDLTEAEPERAAVKVVHHYTETVTTVEDGRPVTEKTVDDERLTESFCDYAGESCTVAERTEYNGKTYVSDEGNAAKLGERIACSDPYRNEVHLYYTRSEEPEKVTVRVEHYYRTSASAIEFNEETGEYDIVEEKTIEHDPEEDVSVSSPLYSGESFTAVTRDRDGFEFNAKASDRLTVKASEGKVIKLYYDRAEDRRSEASVSAQHIYITHLTTVSAGKVVTVDVQDGVRMDDELNGRVGDAYEFSLVTEFGGNEYSVTGNPVLSGVMKVPGKNADVVICYERFDSDLVPADYTVDYLYRTYTMTVDENGVAGYHDAPAEEYGEQLCRSEGVYAGQTVTLPDGDTEGFEAAADNPALTQTLTDGVNAWIFVYEKLVPLDKGRVQVNHHYTVNNIAVDGSVSSETADVSGVSVESYAGETVAVRAVPNGYALDGVSVGDEEAEAAENVYVTVTEGITLVDFYYSRTVDSSRPVRYTVSHVYKTVDWDGTVSVAPSPEALSGSGFATGRVSAAVDDLNGEYALTEAVFNGNAIEGFDPADPQASYTVTLTDGVNEVVYTYLKPVDTRDDDGVSVRVVHRYFARDTYIVSAGLSDEEFVAGAEAEYSTEYVAEGRRAGVWIGADFTAEKQPVVQSGEEDGSETVYRFVNADPESMTVELNDKGEYVITANYIREFSTDPGDDEKPEVNRPRRPRKPAQPEEIEIIEEPDVPLAEGPELNAEAEEVEVSEVPETIEDFVQEMAPDKETEIVEIAAADVPLAAMPAGFTEAASVSADAEPPLADVPATGDRSGLWTGLLFLSALGLAVLNLSGRKEEAD